MAYPKYMDRDPAQTALINAMASEGANANATLGKYDDDGWQFHVAALLKPMGKDKTTDHHATLEVKKMGDQTVAWERNFPHEVPACWTAKDNRLVLGWDLGSDTAKDEIKAHAELEKELEPLKDKKKGMLVETVVPETGVPLEWVILPEVDLTHGSGDVRRAVVSGKYVLVRGEHGNTDIYDLETGVKKGEFLAYRSRLRRKRGLLLH